MLRILALVLAVLAVIFFLVGSVDPRVPFVLLAAAVVALALEGMPGRWS